MKKIEQNKKALRDAMTSARPATIHTARGETISALRITSVAGDADTPAQPSTLSPRVLDLDDLAEVTT